jgi:hypothetical protein
MADLRIINSYPIEGRKHNFQRLLTIEACRKIFIEPNGINVLIRRTPQIRLEYPKGPTSILVRIPQVYKQVKSVPLWSQ